MSVKTSADPNPLLASRTSRDDVKAMLKRAAFSLGLVAQHSLMKIDKLAAAVIARAAEDEQVVDAVQELIAVAR